VRIPKNSPGSRHDHTRSHRSLRPLITLLQATSLSRRAVWVFGELLREFGVGRGEPAGRTVDGTNK